MIKLLRYLKSYKLATAIGALAKFIEALVELLFPLLMKYVIDYGIEQKRVSYIVNIAVIMLVITVVSTVLTFIGQFQAAVAGNGLGHALRSDLLAHIQQLSAVDKGKFGTSSLAMRLNNDTALVERTTAMTIRLILRSPLICLGGIIIALTLDVPLSTIFFVIIPFLAILIYRVLNRSVIFFKKTQVKLDAIAQNVKENITGLRVIKAFNRTSDEKLNAQIQNEEWAKMGIKTTRISSSISPVTHLVMQIAICVLIFIGAQRINQGRISNGTLVAFITYINIVVNALVQVTNLTTNIAKGAAAAKRINDVFNTAPSLTYGTLDTWNEDATVPLIEFDQVAFGFRGRNVLSGLDRIKVFRGQTLGVVGGTGSGKSTLASILSRLIDHTAGNLYLNGHPIACYTQARLRQEVGIVLQNDALFYGSVRDNLALGAALSDAVINKSLEVAQAASFVKQLPEGLDYQIVEGGKNLSGGQRQRLTIARALAHQPSLLILDDSFSALDYITDYNLRAALATEYPQITKIFISQRISAIKDADLIIVLEHGEVVGVGQHAALMENCQIYQEIEKSQRQVKR